MLFFALMVKDEVVKILRLDRTLRLFLRRPHNALKLEANPMSSEPQIVVIPFAAAL